MTEPLRRTFAASPAAVREARAFVRDALAGRAEPTIASDLELALSELASNAVRHAGTPFDVVIATDGFVRVEVEDASPSITIRHPPPEDAADGRGLQIVGELCDRWGVHIVRDRKCVWCERDLPHDASAASED
jgi:anti-sigma regulatory factor (Ser/Thr protein kinase)